MKKAERQNKPETDIRNLKRDLDEARILLIHGFGCPLLIAYMPMLAIKKLKIKNPQPHRLNKKQNEWLKAKMKEFKKMISETAPKKK